MDRVGSGPAPSKGALHEAALAYLSRGSATATLLARVLDRKIAAWARRAERATHDAEVTGREVARCHEQAAEIVARFREVGLVNDAAYAEAHVRRLSQAGRSRRAIAAHLAAKGVDSDTAREALPTDGDTELAAALTFARKRRIGPFARGDSDRDTQRKALGAMARAGFGWGTCERALGMDREQADERLATHRDGPLR